MRKILTSLTSTALIATALTALLVMGQGPTGAHAQEAGKHFPYWTTGAITESENEARIDYVGTKLDDQRSARAHTTDKIDHFTKRIAELKRRRERTRDHRSEIQASIDAHRFLLQSLEAIRGYVTHAFSCRSSESGNDYTNHGDHPNGEQVHGGYQALLSTWDHAYGYTDPHTAPFYVQDRWYIDMLTAGRGGEFSAAGC